MLNPETDEPDLSVQLPPTFGGGRRPRRHVCRDWDCCRRIRRKGTPYDRTGMTLPEYLRHLELTENDDGSKKPVWMNQRARSRKRKLFIRWFHDEVERMDLAKRLLITLRRIRGKPVA